MSTFVTQTFNYTGSQQTVTIPWNIEGDIDLYLYGAGGNSYSPTIQGGAGGFAHVTVDGDTYKGKTLYLYIGGSPSGTAGGYNGGGVGRDTASTYLGTGGGGGTDVRYGGTSLSFRIAVAGGGGGCSAGHGGGDGGTDSGENGAGAFAGAGGGGGSQTSGGAAGNTGGSSTGIAGAGSLGQGGAAAAAVTTNFSNGGGGGGGYYGGGGGGSYSTEARGGSGGGGSNYVHHASVTSVISNSRAGNPADSHGHITVQYTVRDPIVAGDTLTVVGGMSFSGVATHNGGIPLGVGSSMSISGLHQNIGLLTLAPRASMAVSRGPSTIPSLASLVGIGRLSISGFRSTTQTVGFTTQGSMFIQQTSGNLHFGTLASLLIGSRTTALGTSPMVVLSRLDLTGVNVQQRGIFVVTQATLDIPDVVGRVVTAWVTHPGVLSMAAHGAVSLVGQLSEVSAVQMHPRASLGLLARLQVNATLPIISVASELILSQKISHPEALTLHSNAAMAIQPSLLVISAPFFRALAELELTDTQLSNVIRMLVKGALVIDITPVAVLDPPYLHVAGPPADMDFFVTSYPNRVGAITQKVITHVGT